MQTCQCGCKTYVSGDACIVTTLCYSMLLSIQYPISVRSLPKNIHIRFPNNRPIRIYPNLSGTQAAMSARTHYETMGLAKNASAAAIKAAYKGLVLEHHPDKTHHLNSNQREQHTAMFRAIQEAYDVIRDPQRRAEYDRHLELRGYQGHAEHPTFHSNSISRPVSPNGRVIDQCSSLLLIAKRI
jgi:DnaJ-domain-containing protein 1